MSKQTFKFPTGDFSHSEFAALNKVTNQQVWTVYSAARKSGEIIPATPPERKNAGKGKPTLMWIVNPNYVAPVVPVTPAPAVPTTATVTPAQPATPPVVLTDAELAVIAQKQADERAAKEAAAAQAKADKEAAKVAAKAAKEAAKAQAKLDKAAAKAAAKAAKAAAKAAKEAAAVPTEPVTVAASTPAVAPVVVEVNPTEIVSVPAESAPAVELPQTVAVVEVIAEPASAPLAEVTPATAPVEQPFVVAAVVAEAPVDTTPAQTFQGRPVTDTREISETCPLCGTKCLAADSATGVYVWCPAPAEVCKANENPYGHGNNEKAAFVILTQKYGHN